MLTTFGGSLLAALPQDSTYIHPVKLGVVIALFAAWAAFAQWVDKDTVQVNTFRPRWNLGSVIVGVLGTVLLLFLPLFLAAVSAYLVLFLAFALAYVIHRNSLVVESDRVCTPSHLRRILEGKREKKKKLIEIRENVRIYNTAGKRVSIPDEEEDRRQYALVQDLLFKSLYRRAGVIELAPAGQASKVRVEIDGVLSEDEPLPRTDGDSILTFVKRNAGMNLEERRKPQKGKFAATIGDHRYELLVKTGGSTAGESLHIRVLGPERAFKVADLGFSDKQLAVVRELMGRENGLILVTAPPANGLTTTVYSFARSHDAFLENIQMLEYEREMDVENITQKLHEPGEGRTFVGDLQRLARSDPDVIIVPELRDKAAAAVCTQAAGKKQTVYVGLNAADAIEALQKWIALVGDPAAVSRTLLAVTNQRLLRTLCPTCKTPYKPDPARLQKINTPPDQVLYRPPEQQFDKRGNPIVCQACQGSGYVGRTAVFTILANDDELRAMIEKGAPITEIRAALSKRPGLSLQQMALQKVFAGVTSIEEAARATSAPAAAARPRPAASKPAAAAAGAAGTSAKPNPTKPGAAKA